MVTPTATGGEFANNDGDRLTNRSILPTGAHTVTLPAPGGELANDDSDRRTNASILPTAAHMMTPPAAGGEFVVDDAGRRANASMLSTAAHMVMPPAAGGEFGRDEVDSEGSLKAVSPWLKEYVPEHHVLTTPASRDYLYTWLLHCGVRTLTGLARKVNVKNTGWKNTLVCRLLMHSDARVRDSSATYDSVFGDEYTEFWRSPRNQAATVYIAPSSEIVRDTASVEGKRGRAAKKVEQPMSTSEFARLMGVLIEDDDARAALIASGQDLTREQQQRREGRDTFWTTIVERVFNDTSFKIALDVRGCVNGDDENLSVADPNAKPISFRSGVWLKDKFFVVRGLFTRGYDR